MIGNHVHRRSFITLLTATAAAWPLAAGAQQNERVRRVGVLMPLTKDDPEDRARVAALQEGLRRLGWMEGRNIQSEYRWYAGDASRASTLAKELVDLRPDLILVGSTPGTAALQQETRTIPLVFVAVADPVDQGLVESLARPGGNATGFAFGEFSIGTKMLEALKQIAPGMTRIATVYNPEIARYSEHYLRPIEAAAPSFGLEMVRAPVRDPAGIEAAIAAIGRAAGGGLLCLPDTFLNVHRNLIIGVVARYNLPAIYGARFFVTEGGGLMSYAVDPTSLYRQSASYVDRILRGDKPADLPVQQPVKYELVINNKTAKALGIEVPPTLLAIADEVIE
jgi:putative ABC transport system substrate-binding protein